MAMELPQGFHAELTDDGKPVIRVGDHDLSDLKIALEGPIVECLLPGSVNPLYVAWVPVLFEGQIHNPHGMIRVVHEGQAEAIGLPTSAHEVA